MDAVVKRLGLSPIRFGLLMTVISLIVLSLSAFGIHIILIPLKTLCWMSLEGPLLFLTRQLEDVLCELHYALAPRCPCSIMRPWPPPHSPLTFVTSLPVEPKGLPGEAMASICAYHHTGWGIVNCAPELFWSLIIALTGSMWSKQEDGGPLLKLVSLLNNVAGGEKSLSRRIGAGQTTRSLCPFLRLMLARWGRRA